MPRKVYFRLELSISEILRFREDVWNSSHAKPVFI